MNGAYVLSLFTVRSQKFAVNNDMGCNREYCSEYRNIYLIRLRISFFMFFKANPHVLCFFGRTIFFLYIILILIYIISRGREGVRHDVKRYQSLFTNLWRFRFFSNTPVKGCLSAIARRAFLKANVPTTT